MANVYDLNEIVADHRERLLENWDNPKVAAVQAYDALTTALLAIVWELRAIREDLEDARDA